MEVRILDVGHGFCAWAYADNGSSMLIDCGHNAQTGFYPSDYLLDCGCRVIKAFFVLNYDEDHVSGLPRLKSLADYLRVEMVWRNVSITPMQLRALKQESGPIGPGMSALLSMLEAYMNFDGPRIAPPDFGLLGYKTFCNPYPFFDDTNNLSMVLFLDYPGLSMVFPGDLEGAGWRALLARRDFAEKMAGVNVFIASHHGRSSGFAKEIFDVCNPELVIISDESVQYDTQEEIDYAVYAKGVRWATGETRYVLSTRKDGMITIKAGGPGPIRVLTAAG